MRYSTQKHIPISTPGKDLQPGQTQATQSQRQVPMSKEHLSQLFSLLNSGQRLKTCDLLRQTLQVNDFIAEWSVRHLEDQIEQSEDFVTHALEIYDQLHSQEAADYRVFYSKILGIPGHAASGLVAKYHR